MQSSPEETMFSATPEVHQFAGILLDMDGTIVNSTHAIVKHWNKIGREIGVDSDTILASSHGRRTIDVLQLYDPSRATWEHVFHLEGLIPQQYGQDVEEIPGARIFLERLEQLGVCWGIVTSGTTPQVTGWLELLKLAQPKNLVCGEMVQRGKPDPACYLLGHSMLGVSTEQPVLVIEDAPSGIKAAKSAGLKVIALATTHAIDQLKEAGADWIVRDMRSVKLKSYDQRSGIAVIEMFDTL